MTERGPALFRSGTLSCVAAAAVGFAGAAPPSSAALLVNIGQFC
ncbi:MAG TPA: hypothetical protein VFA50_04205 [Stellaceae bacterium]|nr:hypothetical protein [Stellaceae bacterium]